MTFHRLGFTFVRRCIVVQNTFAKERHFPDDQYVLGTVTSDILNIFITITITKIVKYCRSAATNKSSRKFIKINRRNLILKKPQY